MHPKSDLRLVIAAFFIAAVALRVLPHDYNLAAVGALGMFVGCYWSFRIGFLVTMAAMLLSDIIGQVMGVPSMGFYNPWLMLVVYLSVGLSAAVGRGIGSAAVSKRFPLLARVPGGAIASAGLFFLVTNFACWLDPQMHYEKSIVGLLQCYAAAVPFATNTFIGNLLYSGLFFGIHSAILAPQPSHIDSH